MRKIEGLTPKNEKKETENGTNNLETPETEQKVELIKAGSRFSFDNDATPEAEETPPEDPEIASPSKDVTPPSKKEKKSKKDK